MPSFKDHTQSARRVPVSQPPVNRLATIGARPLRMAFVVNDSAPVELLSEILQYNSLLWGGLYNTFVPTDGKTIRGDWYFTLVHHDPDLIFLCGEFTDSLVDQIVLKIQPHQIRKWSQGESERLLKGEDFVGCVPLRCVLNHVFTKYRPITESRLAWPQHCPDSRFYLHALAQFGAYPLTYQDFCIEQLRATPITLEPADLPHYLRIVQETRTRVTPIDLTGTRLSTSSSLGGLGHMVVLSGSRFLQDLCLFWNSRIHLCFGQVSCTFLPRSLLNGADILREFSDFCIQSARGSNHITLASASVAPKALLKMAAAIGPALKEHGIEFVDIWKSDFRFGGFRVYNKEQKEELAIEGGHFRCKSFSPSLEGGCERSRWVIDVQFEPGPGGKDGLIPPKFPGINHLLAGSPDPWVVKLMSGYNVRLANDHLSYRVGDSDEHFSGLTPSETEIIQAAFASNRISASMSDKCKYARGTINLIQGLRGSNILRNACFRGLLKDMQGGKAYTKQEILAYLRRKARRELREFTDDVFADLALKRFFLRGYTFRCPVCDMSRWYSLAEIAEDMLCAGCLSRIQPPTEAPFDYRLNELVCRAAEQGTIPVLLTLQFLQNLCNSSFLSVPGLTVTRDGQVSDIDIAACCDGTLVLCECKENPDLGSSKIRKEVYQQIHNLVEVGLRIGARIIFYSSLAPGCEKAMQKRIESLNNRLKGDIRIHILSLSDLEQGFRKASHPGDPKHTFDMAVRDFLPPVGGSKHGWLRKTGERRMTF